jgi:hypothetical protein
MRPVHCLIQNGLPVIRIGALVAFAVACALAFPAGALAAPAPPMIVEVHPASGEVKSYFDVGARPGRTVSAGSLEIRNLRNRKVSVLLDPVDGLTASTLGSAYRVRGTKRRGATRWMRLSDRRVELAPRGSARVNVSVRPSSSAKPGDYLSGIGVQAAGRGRESKPRGNVAIASVQRYAVGVLVRLPGPRHPLIRFNGARVEREAAGVTFYLSAGNRGNVVLQDVKGRHTITQDGRVVARGPLGPGTFVTGTSIDYPILVPRERAREGSEYRVRAFLRYRGGIARLDTLVRFGHRSAVRQERLGGPAAEDSGGRMLKLLIAAATALALLGILAFLLLRRRSRRDDRLREIEEELDRAQESGESLTLAELLERISSRDERAREKTRVR